jgi:hypothetical protein
MLPEKAEQLIFLKVNLPLFPNTAVHDVFETMESGSDDDN